MANAHRGDVDLVLPSGSYPLRLTLGALAEIEAALAAPDLVALGQRMQAGALSARDLIVLTGAALRGGGGTLSDREMAAQLTAADVPAVVDALGRLFALTFGEAT